MSATYLITVRTLPCELWQPVPLMATIQSLPTEILADVFAFYSHDQFSPPVKILTVCRLWYHTILNSPLVWSALNIRCISNDKDPSIPFIQMWVERSTACPLFLRLDLQDADANQIPILRHSSCLALQKDRIREIYIYHASVWNLWSLEALWPAPNLLRLKIVGDETNKFMPPLELLEFPLFLRHTPQAPRLRSLSLRHCKFDEPASKLGELRDLEISQCTASVLGMRSLLGGGQLKILSVRSWIIDATHEVVNKISKLGPLTLGQLEMLQLDQFPTSAFAGVVMPRLTHASLSDHRVEAKDMDTLLSLISNEGSPLLSLKLELSTVSNPPHLILPALPCLETVRLRLNGINYHPSSILKQSRLLDFNMAITPTPVGVESWQNLFDADRRYKVSIISGSGQ